MKNTEIDTFNYQLLARLQMDCEYYLGHGNRNPKHLWALDESQQIEKMYALFDSLPVAPDWITREDIAGYAAAMKGGE